MSNVQGIDVVDLRRKMTGSFSPGELEILCFDLHIPSGDLPGPEYQNKVIQLIGYCQRHGRLLDLIAYCEEARPHVQWRQEIQSHPASIETVEARSKHQRQLYVEADGIQLVHTILPSKGADDYWDILIYLIRHKSDDLSMVDHAEFFLGRYWGNKIFHVPNSENFIGIGISAYGPVLCTCRVVFTNGREVMLSRYIDFEMTHLYTKPTPEMKDPPRIKRENVVISEPKLARLLGENFGNFELGMLVEQLGTRVENITMASGRKKAFDLVRYFRIRNQLPELLELCRQERPDAQWDDVYEEEADPNKFQA